MNILNVRPGNYKPRSIYYRQTPKKDFTYGDFYFL